MSVKELNIKSLNKTILTEVSIGELESRLREEPLGVTTEMWTGCNCVMNGCPLLFPCSSLNPCSLYSDCPLLAPCWWDLSG